MTDWVGASLRSGRRPLRGRSVLCRPPSAVLLLGGPAESRLDLWKLEDEEGVVIGGDAVVALKAASEAAVEDDLFALGAEEATDGGHEGAAAAGAVAHPGVVDMAGVEAEGAMVAVAAAADRGADERLAVAAFEGFGAVGEARLVAAIAVGPGAVVEAGFGSAPAAMGPGVLGVAGTGHGELLRV